MSRSQMQTWALFALALLFGIVLIITWFAPMNYHVLIGDDLVWIRAYERVSESAGRLPAVLRAGAEGGKFRPVSSALILASTELCRSNFDCYVYMNYGILALNAVLIAFGAFMLGARWQPVIFFAPIVLIVSRFAYYAVLQVMGLMENSCLTWTILFMIAGAGFLRTPRAASAALLIVFYGLALASHERFMVLLVPLVAALLWHRRALGLLRLLVAEVAALLVTVLYLFTKQYVFHVSIFTGSGSTAGASVLATFQLGTFFDFLWQGALNLIGFNTGPAYLSGARFLDEGAPGILLGVFLSCMLGILIYAALRQRSGYHLANETAVTAFLLISIAGLMAASAITPRQEYRWFYAPFAGLILLVCLLLGRISSAKWRLTLLVLLGLAFVSVDVFYKPLNLSNLYFEWASRMAASVKQNIVDQLSSPSLRQDDIYIVTHGNHTIQSWILADDYFFRLYSGVSSLHIHYVDSLEAVPVKASARGDTLVFEISDTQVARIPPQTLAALLSQKQAAELAAVPQYDFISHFAQGKVPPGLTVAGRRPFIGTWKKGPGSPFSAIVLDSPRALRFRNISCQPDSHLVFSALLPSSKGDGANLYVDVRSQEGISRLAEVVLRPAAGRADGWLDFDVPIRGCAGQIDVTLGVHSVGSNRDGDTIYLASIRLVGER